MSLRDVVILFLTCTLGPSSVTRVCSVGTLEAFSISRVLFLFQCGLKVFSLCHSKYKQRPDSISYLI